MTSPIYSPTGDDKWAAFASTAQEVDPEHISIRRNGSTTDGARLLDRIVTYLTDFIVFSYPEQADTAALWIVHTHLYDVFQYTPRFVVRAATRGCGKSTLLDAMKYPSHNYTKVEGVTPAYLKRKVRGSKPTIFVDEVDTIFKERGDPLTKDLQGIINSGFEMDGTYGLAERVDNTWEAVDLPTFCPVALGGIGKLTLPDTVLDRAVIIQLKMALPSERPKRFNKRVVIPRGKSLGADIRSWVKGYRDVVSHSQAHRPQGISDRTYDVWEPLLTIAQVARGDWSERASRACVKLSEKRSEEADGDEKLQLLRDIHYLFQRTGALALTGPDIAEMLNNMEEGDWHFHDDPRRSGRELAKILSEFDIKPCVLPRDVRPIDSGSNRGYRLEDFADAWKRGRIVGAT